MADYLMEGYLTSPFPDDSSTRKDDDKEESNRANDESSDSPHVTSNQQSLKEARRMANNCRDIMRQLQKMTYLRTTPQPLETLFKSLRPIKSHDFVLRLTVFSSISRSHDETGKSHDKRRHKLKRCNFLYN